MKRYLSERAVPHYTERSLAINSAHVFPPQAPLDIDATLSTLKTNSTKFKFPTVMHGYHRNINPVSALYENVQEILLKHSKDHEISRWVLSLFDDKSWKHDLLDAISEDRDTLINVFLQEYLSSDGKEIIRYNIEKFRHYIIVFSSL